MTEMFTGLGEVYDRARPGYPEEAFDFLLRAADLSAGSAVADIGAGTGKFTSGLLRRGLRVTAVEPNADMSSRLERRLGEETGLRTVRASAERTGLGHGSVELVTVAQAFHWFDAHGFGAECRRILAPGGRVALIWNLRRAEDPSIQATAQAFRRHVAGFSALTLGENVTREDIAEFFGHDGFDYEVFANDQDIDRETFMGRSLSASYFPKEGDPGRGPLLAELERIFADHSSDGVYRFPQATHVYMGRMS